MDTITKEITYQDFMNWLVSCNGALKVGPLKWTAERTVDHIDNIYRHSEETKFDELTTGPADVRFVGTLVGNIVTKVLVTIDIQPSGNGFDKLTKHHEEYVFVARNL